MNMKEFSTWDSPAPEWPGGGCGGKVAVITGVSGGDGAYLVPADDNRPRAVCPACDTIHYENPLNVVGTIPVNFADYDIEAPSVGGFVSVEDEGEIELQLTFVPA